MATQVVKFFDLILVGIVSGILIGILLGYNPKTLSPGSYLEQQQNAIKALNTLMPILGLIATLLTLISAILQRQNNLITLLIAAGLLIASGIITRFGNQPINSIVMTWDSKTISQNWIGLRDQWWVFHIMRTLTSFVSFCLIVLTVIKK
jgi:uncharacterized membrane protein